MSSQAPAAPAPDAPVKPAIRPIPPGARPGGQEAKAEPAEQGDSIAGIPDEPEIPGLLTRHGDKLFPDVRKMTAEGREALADDEAPGRGPERGPDGKFLPKAVPHGEGDEGVSSPASVAAPAEPKPAAPEPAPDERVSKLSEERDYGYRAAHAWKSEYERVQAELEQFRNGGANGRGVSATSQPAPAPPPIDPLADLDTEGFERLAVEQGLPQAGKYLAAQVMQATVKHLLPQLREEIMRDVQPLRAEHEARQAISQVDNVIAQAAQYVLADGNPAFPELHGDGADKALERIGRQWSQAGNAPEALFTVQGLMSAIALDRMYAGFAPATVQKSLQAAGASVAQARAAVQQSAPAAAAFVEGSDAPTLPPSAGRAEGFQSELSRALATPPDIDSALGFRKYKAPRYI